MNSNIQDHKRAELYVIGDEPVLLSAFAVMGAEFIDLFSAEAARRPGDNGAMKSFLLVNADSSKSA